MGFGSHGRLLGPPRARKERFLKHLGVGPEFEAILCQILDTLGQQKHRFHAIGVVKITVAPIPGFHDFWDPFWEHFGSESDTKGDQGVTREPSGTT